MSDLSVSIGSLITPIVVGTIPMRQLHVSWTQVVSAGQSHLNSYLGIQRNGYEVKKVEKQYLAEK